MECTFVHGVHVMVVIIYTQAGSSSIKTSPQKTFLRLSCGSLSCFLVHHYFSSQLLWE